MDPLLEGDAAMDSRLDSSLVPWRVADSGESKLEASGLPVAHRHRSCSHLDNSGLDP